MSTPLLDVRDLTIEFDGRQGLRRVVDKLSFSLAAGDTLGIVGESGSGKSQTALAIIGLSPPGARVSGSVRFDEWELLGADPAQLERLRGDRIGFVFQDPMTALNPHLRIGDQLAEVLTVHRGIDRAAAWTEAARMLEAVRIAGARNRLNDYPHEFSGGMRQRVLIAMALLARPRLLIADEPTTALDVTVQSQLLRLLTELQREYGMALLLITHDLGVVGQICDRVLVMYAGRRMEEGKTAAVLARPCHPYTTALLRARPRLHEPSTLLQPISGMPAGDPPASGCAFAPRCGAVFERCLRESPPWNAEPNGGCACFRAPFHYSNVSA